MKPFLEKITAGVESSFVCRKVLSPSFGFSWHFHQEYELTLILKSSGKRFVGDNISPFEAGDLVLLGANLPHTWYTEPSSEDPLKENACEAIVIQFLENFMGEILWGLPEFSKVRDLLVRAQRGLFFPASVFKKYLSLFESMVEKKPVDRLLLFLEIMNGLSEENEYDYLVSAGYNPQVNATHQNRIDEIFQFTLDHFLSDSISQKSLAKKIFMSESAFCHFFKKATGKTFNSYLNELRVSYACKMLIETDEKIVNVCYQSGFQNLSNFNKRFLSVKSCTPKEFRQNFRKST